MDNAFSDFSTSSTSPWTSDQTAALGAGVFFGAYMVGILILTIIVYVALALALSKISYKTKINTKHAWFAWVPILNLILAFNIAGLSGWYILLFLLTGIPFIGWIAPMVLIVYVWMKISKACKKPDYLGLLILIPIANILLPLYLAYGEMLNSKK